MGRVSFYAFADHSLFIISKKSTSASPSDVIGYDATVQSTRILSASIQKPAENLKDNVTIVFEYNEVSKKRIIVFKKCFKNLSNTCMTKKVLILTEAILKHCY